ncbi:MAG: hypothetical protein K2P58_14030 [Hyphomonadaceae bacterium]|nr:hypothetical protein [Hyphomonadaceae bacterium]
MRALDIALAAWALRASPTKPQRPVRALARAVDEPDAASLDRAALPQDRTALVVSLWPPPARQCVAPARYVGLAAPATFVGVFRVTWLGAPAVDARALQARLAETFARTPT